MLYIHCTISIFVGLKNFAVLQFVKSVVRKVIDRST